jgi:hypothetical protein
MIRIAAGMVVVLCLNAPAPATAAMYVIENPAEKIHNPADKMYDPATQTNNPASNIYHPVSRMDNPKALSPPKPAAVTLPRATEAAALPAKQSKDQRQPRPAVPQKRYHFNSVDSYLISAKKSFSKDDYVEFISLTEDALRRISAGTLKSSGKSRQRLINYKTFGYGLLVNPVD